MAVTINDIAQKCGYSSVTVSFVLNGKGDQYHIAKTTQETIRRIAGEMGYQQNELARAIRHGKSNTIGFIGYKHSYTIDILSAIGDVLQERKYSLKVLLKNLSLSQCEDFFQECVSHMVSGIIVNVSGFSDSVVDKFQALVGSGNMPIVMLSDHANPRVKKSTVELDNPEGILQALHYLHSLGHRKIGMVNQPPDKYNYTGFRRDAYLQGLNALNLPFDPAFELIYKESEAYSLDRKQATFRYMREVAPSAVICSTDYNAAQFLSYLANSPWRVPDDVSVIGYGDLDFAQLLAPPLTTIRQDFYEAGREATELLFQLLKGKSADIPETAFCVPVELIKRHSVREITPPPPA